MVICSLALFWSWESISPFFKYRNRVRHATRNLAIGAINAVVLALMFAGATVVIAAAAMKHRIGLLYVLDFSGIFLVVISFVLLDLWTYWWHRFNHAVPLLWRFHRLHHSDPDVDVTTATRFHACEILFSSILRLAVIPIVGVPIETIVLFDLIQLPIISFHHANVSLPAEADRTIRYFVVTPFMHKLHHSRVKTETDSNFSSILSVWDRLFGSYLETRNPSAIRFGLEGFDLEERQSFRGLLRTPLFE